MGHRLDRRRQHRSRRRVVQVHRATVGRSHIGFKGMSAAVVPAPRASAVGQQPERVGVLEPGPDPLEPGGRLGQRVPIAGSGRASGAPDSRRRPRRSRSRRPGRDTARRRGAGRDGQLGAGRRWRTGSTTGTRNAAKARWTSISARGHSPPVSSRWTARRASTKAAAVHQHRRIHRIARRGRSPAREPARRRPAPVPSSPCAKRGGGRGRGHPRPGRTTGRPPAAPHHVRRPHGLVEAPAEGEGADPARRDDVRVPVHRVVGELGQPDRLGQVTDRDRGGRGNVIRVHDLGDRPRIVVRERCGQREPLLGCSPRLPEPPRAGERHAVHIQRAHHRERVARTPGSGDCGLRRFQFRTRDPGTRDGDLHAGRHRFRGEQARTPVRGVRELAFVAIPDHHGVGECVLSQYFLRCRHEGVADTRGTRPPLPARHRPRRGGRRTIGGVEHRRR